MWIMYFIVVIGNIAWLSTALFVLGVVAVVVALVVSIAALAEDEKEVVKKAVLAAKKFAIIAFCSALFSAFTPTTKEMAAIYVIPKIVNRIDKSELPAQLETLATEWVKSQIETVKTKTPKQ